MAFRKLRLPTGYTLLVFDELTEYESSTDTRVSVYPPESDCGSKDDRVAELLLWSQDVPALLAMCGYKEPDDDVRACTGCGTCLICAALPRGLCGDRFDHAPHLHDSTSLGRFWCEADQSKRLPYALERKAAQP